MPPVYRTGTYRLGGAVAGGRVEQEFDASVPLLGRNGVQLIAWLDLYPDEDQISSGIMTQVTGSQPQPVYEPDLRLVATVETARATKPPGPPQSRVFSLQSADVGLSLIYAAVDTLYLPQDAYEGSPIQGGVATGGVFADPSSTAGALGYPVTHVKPPTDLGILKFWARWGQNLWPAIASGGAVVDLRALAGGKRFLAVWAVGYWATATVATDLGWPVVWTVASRPVAPTRWVMTLPVDIAYGAGSPLTASGFVTAALADPDHFRALSFALPQPGNYAVNVRNYANGGVGSPLWVYAQQADAAVPLDYDANLSWVAGAVAAGTADRVPQSTGTQLSGLANGSEMSLYVGAETAAGGVSCAALIGIQRASG